MRQAVVFVPALVLAYLLPSNCQMNGVSQNLMPCYNVSAIPGIIIADNRPSVTLNIFLEIIRRLEDANPTKSAMEISVLFLQRLRQDGIIATGRATDIRWALPFSPYGYEAIKQTILLQRFITNSSLELLYGDLDPVEICSLHYMLSSSINYTRRGDEAATCIRSARYTARLRRDVENPEITEAVEDFRPRAFVLDSDRSQCPIESGVVYTNYGTIKAGQVMNGIATGFSQQQVSGIDNRYAATLSGEIVEAAFMQGTEIIELGGQSGWNSTIQPKYSFLQKRDKLDVTDAEMRGSLDGLFMALKIDNWKSTFSDLKISQILDLYYSPQQKGVFDSSFKACNRNLLFNEMISTENLRRETTNLMTPLYDTGYPISVNTGAFPELANASLEAFFSYLPQLYSRDPQCSRRDPIERVATDLLIFIDSNWSFNVIRSVLSHILDNIDVNKFGTRYTVFGGYDGINITSNGTRYLLDFQKQYNITIHERVSRNFDYAKVYETMESLVKSKLNNRTYSGGESTIALLMPRTIPDESQRILLEQRKEIFKRFMPDLTVLVLGSGSQGDYSSVTYNPKDFNLLNEITNENDIKNLGQSVVDRIKNVPRSIVNPSCGSEFTGSTSTFTLTDYVELNGVNYYKIAPNYFFTGDGTRNLQISELGYGSITVCISRDQTKPNNQTSECETVQSRVLTRDTSGYCDGATLSACSPIYISISGNTTSYKCRDNLCRFPENIKYSISLQNVGCASGSLRVVANLILVFSWILFIRF